MVEVGVGVGVGDGPPELKDPIYSVNDIEVPPLE